VGFVYPQNVGWNAGLMCENNENLARNSTENQQAGKDRTFPFSECREKIFERLVEDFLVLGYDLTRLTTMI